ncbi:glycine cleavage system H protein, mitochondrial [Bombus impatiens]|uniref:Glycine cleavage system H protein n=1 Tax=Bombus impatiens TaxID=132113 RepID=A0A6P3DP25_BOMIM|nr:glycine cleavage system H protein, mitochondrial [Bombus impatiens]
MAKVVAQMAKYTAKTFLRTSRENLFNFPTPKVSLYVSRSIVTTRCLNAERFYTEKHEWITIDGNIGIVGISNYAQEALGDVVYAQLPDVGSEIEKEVECGALESVKAASDLYSPVSGKVIAKNEEVEKTPSLINTSCYEKGWLFKIELSKSDDLKSLMNEEAYNEYLKSDPS